MANFIIEFELNSQTVSKSIKIDYKSFREILVELIDNLSEEKLKILDNEMSNSYLDESIFFISEKTGAIKNIGITYMENLNKISTYHLYYTYQGQENEIVLNVSLKILTGNNTFSQIDELQEILVQAIREQKRLVLKGKINFILYKFLKPHIIGAKRVIEKINQPIIITYHKNNNEIRLLKYRRKKLLNFARNRQRIHDLDKPTLRVSFNDKTEMDLIPINNGKQWRIVENHHKIPDKGNLIVIKDLGKQSNMDVRLNELYRHIKALNSLKNDSDRYSSKMLLNIIQNRQDHQSSFDFDEQIEALFSDFEEMEFLHYLEQEQVQAIKNCIEKDLFILLGDAGTGKTEIGVILLLLYLITGKRVLIALETNEALDNFLLRINNKINDFHKFIQQRKDLNHVNDLKNLNIIRIESKQHKFSPDKMILKKYALNDIFNRFKDISNKKNNKNILRESLNGFSPYIDKFKADLDKILSNRRSLEQFCCFTFDAVFATHGLVAQRRFFNKFHNSFDLYIVDCANLLRLRKWVNGANISKKWLVLGDPSQLKPLPEDFHILKQRMRIPSKIEIENAEEWSYDNYRKKPLPKDNESLSNRSVIDVFLKSCNLEESNKKSDSFLMVQKLKVQHRMEEDLCREISNIFQKEYVAPKNYDESGFLNLAVKDIPLIRQTPRFKRIFFFKRTRFNEEDFFYQFINEVKNLPIDKKISIGVSSDKLDNLRILLSKLINSKHEIFKNGDWLDIEESLEFTSKFRIHEELYEIFFTSIMNHEESEYDFFIIYMNKTFYRQPTFEDRLYSAMSRASSYVYLIGDPIAKTLNHIPVLRKIKMHEVK